jgi:glycosyltransferase involved in cell wall biosynthesis
MSNSSTAVTVSVVVPALDEERHLGHLLRDLGRQTRKPQEVIVVDAGSHDGTVAVAQGFARGGGPAWAASGGHGSEPGWS